jgi:hypothetical protein
METVEVMIYFTIALIVGFLIYMFTASAGFEGLFSKITGEKEQEFDKVSKEEFVKEAIRFWEGCGMGEVPDRQVFMVQGDGELNRSFVFSEVKRLNYCQTLQSTAEDCGMREDSVIASINLPRVVRLECDAVHKHLVIS